MASARADALFWTATAAIAVTQWLILRSTWRGMHRGVARGNIAREWIFAIAPAVALAVLLAFTWRAMHPATLSVDAVAPAGPRA
jgi:heme/copper-type cytochrome/quinol oxidase subunit 2